ncbi:MAG: helix-turn-helix transcriptional regulator [Verrucomicrobia bacterium]|nr:helix-turn-helix transcriptional regulator [Verrucomicrobiota bacterium]
MRKADSTNSANERGLIVGCPMTFTASVLGRRWKPIILWKIREGVELTADLRRSIPLISRKMLFQEVQSLLELGLISRQTRAGAARGARYRLTELGQSLVPVLQAMIDWGDAHRPRPSTRPR